MIPTSENNVVVSEPNAEKQAPVTDNQVQGGNQSSDPLDPWPANKQKVYDYLVGLYAENNKRYNGKKLQRLSETTGEDLKYWVNFTRDVNGLKPLGTEEYDSLYKTWLDTTGIEKKNLVQTIPTAPEAQMETAGVSESPSVSDTGDTSLDSSEDKGIFGTLDYDYYYREAVGRYDLSPVADKLPLDWMKMNENDAMIVFNNLFEPFGFQATQKGSGNVLQIERPDRTTFDVPLSSGIAYAISPTDESRDLMKFREFMQNMNLGSQNIVLQMAKDFSENSQILDQRMAVYQNFLETPSAYNMSQVEAIVTGDPNATGKIFYDANYVNTQRYGAFLDQGLSILDAQILKMEQRDRDQVNVSDVVGYSNKNHFYFNDKAGQADSQETLELKAMRQTLKEAKTDYLLQKAKSSKLISKALEAQGIFDSYDLNDQEALAELEQYVSRFDIPLEGLTLNGQSASISEVYDIISRPLELRYVRDGRISLEIDPSKAPLPLQKNVQDLLKLQDRNRGYLDETGMPRLVEFMNQVVDVPQELHISVLELMSDFGYAAVDGLTAMGIDREAAEKMVYNDYGAMALGGIPTISSSSLFGFYSPEYIQNVYGQNVPSYDMSISDARDIAEAVALGMDAMTASAPYTAAFLINPYLGIGVTAAGTYGGSLQDYHEARNQAMKDQQAGYQLTEKQMELLNMSDNDFRLASFEKAGLETAFTWAFTGRMFRNLHQLKDFKNLPKTVQNAQIIAREYAKHNRSGLIASFARATGLDPKIIALEVKEEAFIAATQYMVDVQFGLEKYNPEKMYKMMADAGLNSLFTSVPMSVGSKMFTQDINKVADGRIRQNLNLPGETEALAQFANIDSELKSYRENDNNNPQYEQDLISIQADLRLTLTELNDKKQALVDKLTPSDKVKILESQAEILRLSELIKEGGSPGIVDGYVKNIAKHQRIINTTLSKHPSELGYYFLPINAQLKYQTEAADQLEEELKKQLESEEYLSTTGGYDQEGNFTFSPDEINQRAALLYQKSVLDFEETTIPDYLGAANTESLIGRMDDYYHMQFVDADVDTKGKYNLNDALDAAMSPTLFEQAEAVKPTVEDENVDPQQQSRQEFEASQVARRTKALENLRLLNRNATWFDGLSKTDQDVVKNFMSDVINGRRPKFGMIESIINASNTAYELRAAHGDKIRVFPEGKGIPFELTNPIDWARQSFNELLKSANSWGRKSLTGMAAQIGFPVDRKNMMTGDILAQTIFRDEQKGKAFTDTWNKAVQSTAVAFNQASEQANVDLMLFNAEITEYNKSQPKGVGLDMENPMQDMMLQVLGALKRQTGEIDPATGMDTEFLRQKNVFIRQLEILKELAEKNPNDEAAAKNYAFLKEALEILDISNATSFEDVASRAPAPLVSFTNRAATRFPHEQARQSKLDYHGKEMFFVEGTYLPTFRITNDGADVMDGARVSEDNYALMAGLFEDVTNDDKLETSQVSFGNYAKRVYEALRGARVDIESRGNWVEMVSLVNSGEFKEMFEDEDEYKMVRDYYQGRWKIFTKLVRGGFEGDVSYGAVRKSYGRQLGGKIIQAVYSGLAAYSLVSLSQPMSQYVGALAGTYATINDPAAKAHLQSGLFNFLVFHSEARNGNKSPKYINWYKELLGSNDLSNIYANSRTGLRNAMKAEFAIGDKAKVPLQSYLSYFNVTDEQLSNSKFLMQELKANTQYSVLEFLDLVQRNSELGLELFLANADKAAANRAFEAHYMQARIDQGARLPKDIKSWWKKENENPNMEAIQYADKRVAETMRQTDPMSEASYYDMDVSAGVKFEQMTLYAYGKFIQNARANFANQYARYIDQSLPESQRQEAQQRMIGLVNEVLTFNGAKNIINSMWTKGAVGGLFALLGGDEDDIKRYGGETKLINDYILALEDPNLEDYLTGLPRSQKETLEAFHLALREDQTGIGSNVIELLYLTKQYENKLSIREGDNPVLKSAIDTAELMVSGAIPSELFDVFYAYANYAMFKDDVIPEYMSSDIANITDTDSFLTALKEHAGIVGVGAQALDSFRASQEMYMNGTYTKPGSGVTGKPVTKMLLAETPAQQENLDMALKILANARIANLFNPYLRQSVNKTLNNLERSIEKNYAVSLPSIEGITSEFMSKYIQIRVSQGAVIDKNNLDAWWRKEQKSMNYQAKRQAEQYVEDLKMGRAGNWKLK